MRVTATSQGRFLVPVLLVVLVIAGSCSITGDETTVDTPRLGGVDEVGDLALATDTEVDDGAETIVAPDFELELKPGQDPDDFLGSNNTDSSDIDPSNDGTPTPARPPDALLALCPAVAAVVAAGGVADADARLAVMLEDTPADLHEAVAATATGSGLANSGQQAQVDRYFSDLCSIPLHAAFEQLRTACGTTDSTGASCRDRVISALGGLCFDDDNVMLSCVSGLPAFDV
jgi:hypothetical protein